MKELKDLEEGIDWATFTLPQEEPVVVPEKSPPSNSKFATDPKPASSKFESPEKVPIIKLFDPTQLP